MLIERISSPLWRYSYNVRYSLRLRKPKALARIGLDLSKVALGQRPLRYVDLALDYGCNLKCVHCSAEGLKRCDSPALEPSQWRDVVDQALDLGAVVIGFTGGEPLLQEDLEDRIQDLDPSRFFGYVVTNGTLLTAKRAKSLYRSGVDMMAISLDSADPQEHDSVRGVSGVSGLVWQGVRNALEAGIRVVVSTTVSRTSLYSEGFRELVEDTRRMRLMTVLLLACPVGKWTGRDDVRLGPDDMKVFDDLIRKNPHLRRDFESNWVNSGCAAGKEKVYVTSYGDVLPCPFYHISFGNIREFSLAHIRQKMLKVPELKNYHPVCITSQDRELFDLRKEQSVKGEGPPRWNEPV